ncbi:MAG: methylenetetrahydrofolate--tRNA-(uracil(54)-C(5))-methyltransferase (FADH(2)-oxidizing) TrmFO [Candidatus Eisenbacteria sp.]|nr:methylenetetrahydrofolate--tRNA-(uracil(54)-C(5))-methyltransferase (FADH(2)-oxidizing) TrmFO [Candidatus Eisenbacteria bacterium]
MHVTVIGGGLAGSEAAWQAAESGVDVTLFEMRPHLQTSAHQTGELAELVCSNSLKSRLPSSAAGLLKAELTLLGSVLLQEAETHSVPAGSALAVDRIQFAKAVTKRLHEHPRIRVVRKEIKSLPPEGGVTVVASGPLTSPCLADSLKSLVGGEYLYFYDAISPIVMADSVDTSVVFPAARYEKGGADYLNCPFTREQYYEFIDALVAAERFEPHAFERGKFFGACAPVEDLAGRGPDTLAFGSMRPVGLVDPRTGERPFAVVQLRSESRTGSMFTLVGFQTRLRQGEQRRVFRMIPGLESAEFARYGSLHRNTFICSPRVLGETLEHRWRESVFFGGQLTGVEGYVESIGTGWLAGQNAARRVQGRSALLPPETTALGCMVRWLATASAKNYQPMNINFGLLPPLGSRVGSRKERYRQISERALAAMRRWAQALAPVSGRGEGVARVEGRD